MGNNDSNDPGDDSSTRNRMLNKRLSSYHSKLGNAHVDDEDFIVPLLAASAFHIPGNTWGEDWRQFMCNNHPVFGICCHHRHHPIKTFSRLVALFGIFVFGFAITNLFYLLYIMYPNLDQDVMSFVTYDDNVFTLTTGTLLLWTAGAAAQAFFNLSIWIIAACACCRPGGSCERRACCPSLGKHMVRALILVIFICAIFVLLMRVAINKQTAEDELQTDLSFEYFFTSEAWDFKLEDTEDGFSIVFAYLVHMASSLFIFYPLIGTILLSGVLGCFGKLPYLGGRPYEMAQWEKKRQKLAKKHEKVEDWELENPTDLTGTSSHSKD